MRRGTVIPPLVTVVATLLCGGSEAGGAAKTVKDGVVRQRVTGERMHLLRDCIDLYREKLSGDS